MKDKFRDVGNRLDNYLKRLSNRDDYSLRVGDYRVFVDWDKADGVLYVTGFNHRDGAYD